MTALDANDVLQANGEAELRRRFDTQAARKTDCVQLDDVYAVFRKWLGDEYDLDSLTAMLAAVAAERLKGDLLWLLIVSGPGGAKTETVQALSGVDGACITSTIASEGALLSASARRERVKGATGGLLRRIGERGLLIIKDVTSILSANRDLRGPLLAALREIHDGCWERNVGSDGGQSISWKGRIAVIGAVTTAWDTHHAVGGDGGSLRADPDQFASRTNGSRAAGHQEHGLRGQHARGNGRSRPPAYQRCEPRPRNYAHRRRGRAHS